MRPCVFVDADGEETTVPVKLDEEESNIRIIEVPDLKVGRHISNVQSSIIIQLTWFFAHGLQISSTD